MQIITVANQKGGAGKTSVTMLVADELHRRGRRVLVIDADPQGSLHKWEARTVDGFAPVAFPVEHLYGLDARAFGLALHKRLSDEEFILIDTPPNLASKELHAALYVSDLVVIPFVPDEAHRSALEDVMPLLDEVNQARSRDGDPPMTVRLLINRHDSRRPGERLLAQNAAQVTRIETFQTRLGNWSAIQNAWNYHTGLATVARPKEAPRVALVAAVDEMLGVLNG